MGLALFRSKAEHFPLKSGQKLESTFDGVEYACDFKKESRNEPSRLRVWIPCFSKGSFKVVPSPKQTSPLSVGNPEFEERLSISSNAPECAQAYFEDLHVQRAALNLLDLSVCEITHDGKNLFAVWSPFEFNNENSEITEVMVHDAVRQLHVMSKDLTAVFESNHKEKQPKDYSKIRKILQITSSCFPVLCVLPCVFIYHSYFPMRPFLAFLYSLCASVPASFLFLLFYRRAKIFFPPEEKQKEEKQKKDYQNTLYTFIIGLLILSFAGLLFWNGELDESPTTQHNALVLNKSVKTGRRKKHYFTINSWINPGEQEDLEVSSTLYHAAQPGLSSITVTTRSGALGFEWPVLYELKTPGNESYREAP